MKRVILLLIIILNIYTINSYAISAKSAVLIDANSGRVLYEHNSYEKLPMASTTKIMTGLLACESGKFKSTVKASPFASGTEGSSLWLKIGERLTLENLTYGLMLKSGNDAAVAIAEYLGGSVDAFVLLMNKRAKEIGAVNTNFKNPHGLDAEGHYTTAYDLALIAREAMKNRKFAEIVSTKNYTIPMEGEKWGRALKNHNKLLWSYDGCIGIKTGYTKKCGRCLVSCAAKDGQDLICVTLNAPDDWKDHTSLLDYGFENFSAETVAEKGEFACKYTYDKKERKSVDLLYGEDFVISKSGNDEITTQTELKEISPSAEKGSIAGKVRIYCNGEEVGEISLVTAEKLKQKSFIEKLKSFIISLFN